jgi:5'-3' exonuclease
MATSTNSPRVISAPLAPGRVLVDFANLYVRCRYSIGDKVTDKHGRPTGAMYGFVKTIEGLVKRFDIEPSQIYIAQESGGSARRRKVFDGYKSDRTSEPLFLAGDHKELFFWSIAFGARWVSAPNTEADDVIAHLAKAGNSCIYSRDHDFWPLLSHNNFMLDTPNGQAFDRSAFIDKHGYDPIEHRKLLWLTGDPSDAIPQAISRCGEATALKIWRECDWDIIRLAQHPKVHADPETWSKILRNRELVDPIPLASTDLIYPDPDNGGKSDAGLWAWYERFDMMTLANAVDRRTGYVASKDKETA